MQSVHIIISPASLTKLPAQYLYLNWLPSIILKHSCCVISVCRILNYDILVPQFIHRLRVDHGEVEWACGE